MAKLTANFRQAALRRGLIVKTKQNTAIEPQLRFAASVELANLGFVVNPVELDGMSAAALNTMLADARIVIGADRNMVPVYPGFPQQVEALSTLTLLVEQILHYWTFGAFLPDYPTIAREGLPIEDMLRNAREVTVLDAANTARKLTEQLVTDPIALSVDDKAILEGALELQHPSLEEIGRLAKAAKNGENLQTFIEGAASVTSFSTDEILSAVLPYLSNADQLLRVVLVLGSTPSEEKWRDNYDLAVGTLADRHVRSIRMNKLSRSVRRAVVSRLGEVSRNFNADRLVARRDLWQRVLRAVHPYDFPLSEAQKRAVDIVHENVEYRTLNSLVEEGMENGKVKKVVRLLAEYQPGNLLRRVVAILRLVKNEKDAKVLADALRISGVKASLTTLISAYNGVISANDEHARVTRVAGLTNTMVNRESVEKVDKDSLAIVAEAIKDALRDVLATRPAPKGSVGIVSKIGVPLIRRDASTTDRVLDRGQEVSVVGKGDVLRLFGHWNNNQSDSGYMDIGAVVLDAKFNILGVSTWNTYSNARGWSTYSGDKLVHPGGNAVEYIDVKLEKLRVKFPKARWVALTVQSWSGWGIEKVDFIAGAMLRSNGEKGEVFDARTVATAFKPTTASTQSVPLAVDLKKNTMVWLDTSNGSTASGVSSSEDTTIGNLVYDEIKRPRLTMGQLATLWAEAHNAKTVSTKVDRDQILSLLS